MVARLSRLILLVQLLAAAGIGWLLHRFAGWTPLLGLLTGLLLVLALRLAITLHNFVICRRFHSPPPSSQQLRPQQALRLVLEEFHASMRASSWTMPFRPLPGLMCPEGEGLPVLLLHGYGCNSGYWREMSRALTQANIPHLAVDLEPVLGAIDDYVPLVRQAVQRLGGSLQNGIGERPIILLGHSMGGLVARSYLRAHGLQGIAGVITLGTPHHGTALADFGAGINSQQMRRWVPGDQTFGNPWLEQLADAEDAAVRQRIVSIYSQHENIIAPQVSSHLPGARNIALHGMGHVALGSHPEVLRVVLQEVQHLSRRATTSL